MTNHKIIGTAGHIDHGKTALVKALTGTDTDRLKEEKEREITIDLGFAFLDDSIAFVDVPGHERFVKNMVAGVTGIDLALLVIAADDGIMPQTREHLDIIRLLKVESIVVALTKVDLFENDPAGQDWVDMVGSEIVSLLTQYGYKDSPVIPVSSVYGKGIDELRSVLIEKTGSSRQDDRKLNRPFRLPVDRSFSMTGFGTVVTGTVISGSLKPDDSIELLPLQKALRLRSLQRHNKQVERISTGERAAINLGGIQKSEIRRGDIVALSGHYIPSNIINCQLHYLNSAKSPLKYRERLRFHTGTLEVIGRVIIFAKDHLEPGETDPVQLQLENPVSVSVGDRFIIRKYSPAITIGGGTVLEINAGYARKSSRKTKEYLYAAADLSFEDQIYASVVRGSLQPTTIKDIAIRFGIFPNHADEILSQGNDKIIDIVTGGKPSEQDPQKINRRSESIWIDRDSYRTLMDGILQNLSQFHATNPAKPAANQLEIIQQSGLNADEAVWKHAFENLADEGRIICSSNRVILKDFVPKISEKEDKIRIRLLELLKETGAAGPSMQELSGTLSANLEDVRTVVELLIDEGSVCLIDKTFLYSADELNRMEMVIREKIQKHGSITISDFRTALNTSRKYALPLLNYFDDIGITVRVGDERVLK